MQKHLISVSPECRFLTEPVSRCMVKSEAEALEGTAQPPGSCQRTRDVGIPGQVPTAPCSVWDHFVFSPHLALGWAECPGVSAEGTKAACSQAWAVDHASRDSYV